MGVLGWILRSPWRYRRALRMGRRFQRRFVQEGWITRLPGLGGGWTQGRDLQSLPEESFREWWDRERGKGQEKEKSRSLPAAAETEPPSRETGQSTVPRDYRRKGTLSRAKVLDRFVERVSDYHAMVIRTRLDRLPTVIARALEARGARRMVVPGDLPESWVGGVSEGFLDLLRDGEGGRTFSKGQLASCHGVITGCAQAIAETGTIILDSGSTQGRRALSLLPDYHLCVVFGRQVVETVPEALEVVSGAVRDHGRPLTFVSGPSATSDIELIRVEGVHGPRNLEVILVEEES